MFAGVCRRSGDLYGGGNILLKAKNVFKGLQGVENVYTQHQPLLVDTLRLLGASDLSPAAYPYAASSQVRPVYACSLSDTDGMQGSPRSVYEMV